MAEESSTTALRQEIANRGTVVVHKEGTEIGGKLYKKAVKSAYSSARGVQYSLSSVALLYVTREQDHGEYLVKCRESEVDPVSFMDRDRIIAELLIPPVEESFKINTSFRTDGLTEKEIVGRYRELEKEGKGVLEYIVVPKLEECGVAAVKNILKEREGAKELEKNEIFYNRRRLRVVDDHAEVDSVRRIAAVFIDGSTWQFKTWPKEIVEVMKSIPVFYLLVEKKKQPNPILPSSVTVLKVGEEKASISAVSNALWSILGHNK